MGGALTAGPAGARDRRRSARIEPGTYASVIRLRLPPGREAVLLNLSRDGACIETSSALLPGRPVDLMLSLPGWAWRGRATVLRCRVTALVIDSGVRYEAAVHFELPLDREGPARLLEAAEKAITSGHELPAQRTSKAPRWAVNTRLAWAPDCEDAERP